MAACYICHEERPMLTSKTVQGQSIALCEQHVNATTLPDRPLKKGASQ